VRSVIRFRRIFSLVERGGGEESEKGMDIKNYFDASLACSLEKCISKANVCRVNIAKNVLIEIFESF
jgi:hypothetical protein